MADTCIICGEHTVGTNMICEDCKEAFLDYKKIYFIAKKAKETNELDEPIFDKLYKEMDIHGIINDDLHGLFPPEGVDQVVEDVNNGLTDAYKDLPNDWMNQKGRLEKYKKYCEERLRKEYAEAAEKKNG